MRGECRGVPHALPSLRGDAERDADGKYHYLAKSRRSVLSSILALTAVITAVGVIPMDAFAETETMERGGVPLTPFNSLAFNYRGTEITMKKIFLNRSFSIWE